LPFDFAIFDDSNNLIGMIEYHGEQHYHKHRDFKKNLDEIQKRDKINVDYCKDNNIPLLVIPYKKYKEITTLVRDFHELLLPNRTQAPN
jgi:hypothetical protein